jgi:hypothetical protein
LDAVCKLIPAADMLTAVEEAAAAGNSGLSGNRRVPSGRLVVTAPRAQILEFWAHRTTPPPQLPAGLTRTQWAALQSLAADGTEPSRTTRTRLTAAGWLDDEGALTDTARALLDAQPQETTDA